MNQDLRNRRIAARKLFNELKAYIELSEDQVDLQHLAKLFQEEYASKEEKYGVTYEEAHDFKLKFGVWENYPLSMIFSRDPQYLQWLATATEELQEMLRAFLNDVRTVRQTLDQNQESHGV